MDDNQRRYLAEVRRIVSVHLRPEEADVYLFGSWARDDIRQHSDIDVAIQPREAFNPGCLPHLRDALEESHVPYAVDVVDLTAVEGPFRDRVMREGVRWSA